MRKRILVLALALAVALSYCIPSFAYDTREAENKTEQIVDIVEDVVSNKDVVDELEKEKGYYIGETATDAAIPVDADNPISLGNGEDEDVELYLPDCVEDEKGKLMESGEVVFESSDENVSIVSEMLDGKCCGVRNCIVIEDCDAPREYPFELDLPDGYSIVADYDYDDGCEEYDCGDIYVLDENGEISYTIEKPWAKDSQGNDIRTEFVIRDNTITQIVFITEDSNFPIVADPAIISYKELTALYTRSQVKTLRDKYTTSANDPKWAKGYAQIIINSLMIDLGTAKIITAAGIATSLPVSTILGVTVGCVLYAGDRYKAYLHDTYDMFYEGFEDSKSRKRLKVVAYYKWSSNLEGYVEYKKPKMEYTSKIKL